MISGFDLATGGLQWGRVQTDAEGGTPPTSTRAPRYSFNGAASKRTRKGQDDRGRRASGCRLQWGRVQTDAEG